MAIFRNRYTSIVGLPATYAYRIIYVYVIKIFSFNIKFCLDTQKSILEQFTIFNSQRIYVFDLWHNLDINLSVPVRGL